MEQDEGLVFKWLASRIERWVCSEATWTMVVLTPLKRYLEAIGVPEGKCVVMPNGVDAERFAPRAPDMTLRDRLGIPSDRCIVGFTGVLRPWHGLDLLVRAVRKMVQQGINVFLLIVGDGPYRGKLEEIVSQLGLGAAVCVTGRVPHERVPDYVGLFDVAVSPRATFYASPMKVIEYMALGKPIVVPRTPNFLDIIDEGVEGVTFEDGSEISLERALSGLCTDVPLRREIGARARAKVERRLNWRWNATTVCRLVAARKDGRMSDVPG